MQKSQSTSGTPSPWRWRWGLVAKLAAPLYGHSAIPALIALRIVISHCLRRIDDPADALRMFIADLNAALEQKPARPN